MLRHIEIAFSERVYALGSLGFQFLIAMKYRIEDRIIIITLVGLYSIEELLALTRKALDDPDAKKPAMILVDASLSKTVRNTAEMESVATIFSGWKDEIGKVAIFVTSEVHYGLVRMGTAFSSYSSFDIAPFRSYEEALAFLKTP